MDNRIARRVSGGPAVVCRRALCLCNQGSVGLLRTFLADQLVPLCDEAGAG